MYDRIIKLIGEKNLNIIKSKHILIIGIGGVGGTALETLVRSGIQSITIVDGDKFEISNLNRQIISTKDNINEYKVEAAKERYLSINNELNINTLNYNLNKDNIVDLGQFDYIIDACDTITTKIDIIKYALEHNIKIISCMGTGKRLDPTKLEITTLNKTFNDPLAKVMRRELRDYPLNKILVVFSKEEPMNNDEEIASMMMVPSTAGIYMAYYVISDIIKLEL